MPYRYVYDVRLLDDLHNYFPAILYEPDRFISVGQLLAYVRGQARNHFDTFTRETRAHALSTQPLEPPIHANPRRAVPRDVRNPPAPVQMVFEENDVQDLASQMLHSLLGGHSMASVSLGLGSRALEQNLQPVIVRPTAEQIASATTTEVVTGGSEMCSICQDLMATETQARVLNACNHRFHTGCIDTWFTRNVVCPVCRHDVRVP